jgi:hypothetical protein
MGEAVTFPAMFRPLAQQPRDLPAHLCACTCTWCIRGKAKGSTCPKCNGRHKRTFKTMDLRGPLAIAEEVA